MTREYFTVSQMVSLAKAHLRYRTTYLDVKRQLRPRVKRLIPRNPDPSIVGNEIGRIEHDTAQYGLSKEPILVGEKLFKDPSISLRERYWSELSNAIDGTAKVSYIESTRRLLMTLEVQDPVIQSTLTRFATEFVDRRVPVLEEYVNQKTLPPSFVGYSQKLESKCFGPVIRGKSDLIFASPNGKKIVEVHVDTWHDYLRQIPGTRIPVLMCKLLQAGVYSQMMEMSNPVDSRETVEAVVSIVPSGIEFPVDTTRIPQIGTELAKGLTILDSMDERDVKKLDKQMTDPHPEFLTHWNGESNA